MNAVLFSYVRLILCGLLAFGIVNTSFSQVKNSLSIKLKILVNDPGEQTNSGLIEHPKLVINRNDTIELIRDSPTEFKINLDKDINTSRPFFARFLVTKIDSINSSVDRLQSNYFLIDTSVISVEWSLFSKQFKLNAGRENEVLDLFNNVDQDISRKMLTNKNLYQENVIDSLTFIKGRNYLEIIERNNENYISYTKLLTLLKPSFFDLNDGIEMAISTINTDNFSNEEVNTLNKRFEEFIEAKRLSKDLSQFPMISTVNFKDGLSFDSLKNQYDFIFLDLWATWCGPCLVQHPTIDSLYSSHKNSDKFTIVGLSLSSNIKAWKSYMEKGIVQYPNYFLDETNSGKLIKAIRIFELPRYALLRTQDSKLIEQFVDFKDIESVLRKHGVIQ